MSRFVALASLLVVCGLATCATPNRKDELPDSGAAASAGAAGGLDARPSLPDASTAGAGGSAGAGQPMADGPAGFDAPEGDTPVSMPTVDARCADGDAGCCSSSDECGPCKTC